MFLSSLVKTLQLQWQEKHSSFIYIFCLIFWQKSKTETRLWIKKWFSCLLFALLKLFRRNSSSAFALNVLKRFIKLRRIENVSADVQRRFEGLRFERVSLQFTADSNSLLFSGWFLWLWHELQFCFLCCIFQSVAQRRVRPPVAEWDMNVYLNRALGEWCCLKLWNHFSTLYYRPKEYSI